MSEAVILEAVRTPFGRRGGALREQRPDSLLAHALKGLVQRAGIDPEKIKDVVDGTVTLAGEQGANPGRLGVLLAGFPVTVAGSVVEPHVRLEPAGRALRGAGLRRGGHGLRHRFRCGEHDAGAHVPRYQPGARGRQRIRSPESRVVQAP